MVRFRRMGRVVGWLVFPSCFSSIAAAQSTPYLLSRYIAKEYCSCRFVVKQSPQVCKNENKATNIFFRIHEDPKEQVITVTNIWGRQQARFISDNEGCLLVKDKS